MPVATDPITALLGFAAIIVFLLILITKHNWHVFLALLVPILLFGLLPDVNLQAFIEAFEKGFGSTLSSIGIVIVLGSIMSEALKNTGAVKRITMGMVNTLGQRHVPLALTLTGFILGIAIFGDVAYVVLNPLVHSLAMEFGASMGLMATGLVGALQLTHAIVPPTPGPLAAAAMLGADLGVVILYGSIASLFGAAACWLWGQFMGSRIDSPPSEEFVKEEAEESDKSETNLPSTWRAYLPITVPILLIAGQSVADLLWPEGNSITGILSYLGWPVVALSLGLWLAFTMANRDQKQDAVSDWVQKGINTSAIIMAVTGLGGSLSYIIRGTPTVDFVADIITEAGIPAVALPFLIGTLVNMITGSSTVGVITAASLTAPLLDGLGLSAEAAMLAGACGSVIIKYVNSSYFWVCTSLSGMEVDDAIKSFGGATLVGGLTSFAAVYVMWVIGLI